MADIRGKLGLDRAAFARLIGYTGTDRNDDTRIRKYEQGKQQIPLYIARLVWLLGELKLETSTTSPVTMDPWTKVVRGWPEWEGYEFEHTPDHEIDDPDTAYVDAGQFKAARR